MRRRGTGRGNGGQALGELAIALPILIAIAVGIFEFGRAWNIRQVLVAAAREGARFAVVPAATEDQVQAEIDERLAAAGLDPGAVTTTIQGMEDGIGQPTRVTLTTEYTFQFLGPVVGLISEGSTAGGTITLTGTAAMRNES